ncbi:uncharacterized protein LOC132295593 [Cornus florida]|uniref:uncharacterized protein LOC132295593 n=1 Tax=Cornus florida TaxID=4283 RepID=UPI0028A165B7|nr:uncharacterized protein LOC132295593 [Cornus florida]
MQESYRKDVERVFGALQARFAIVWGLARFWSHEDLNDIMKACIILHNMIIEDERDNSLDDEYDAPEMVHPFEVSQEPSPLFSEFLARHHMILSSVIHHTLHNDLIEHLWSRQGET